MATAAAPVESRMKGLLRIAVTANLVLLLLAVYWVRNARPLATQEIEESPPASPALPNLFSSDITSPTSELFALEAQTNGTNESAPQSGGTDESADELSASMPLVFELADLSALNLDEGQQEGLDELRQQFIADVGGLDQEPNDPAYAVRWQQAQPRIDSSVPGLLGREAFLRMQMESSPDANQP